jgi:hypothetical protein
MNNLYAGQQSIRPFASKTALSEDNINSVKTTRENSHTELVLAKPRGGLLTAFVVSLHFNLEVKHKDGE